MFLQKKENLFIGRFAGLWRLKEIMHGFSTRKGGVSLAPYNSLNLGFNTKDNPLHTEKNREHFFRVMGVSSAQLAIPQQVHGTRIEVVTKSGMYPETDALVTQVPGIVLVIQVADCVPLFFYDPLQRVVGLVHSGWKGSRDKLVLQVIRLFSKEFGSRPSNIVAWIGPSIGPCCYEVDQDVAFFFPGYVKDHKLDLWTWNRDLLVQAGLSPHHIRMSRLCTVCHSEWFFSHRKSGGETGRMMALIGLKAL